MTGAWKLGIASGPKLVLLSLCDNANDQGECFPSIPMIAQRCSLSERAVQGHIQGLVDQGFLRRIERNGRSTVYHLDPRRICAAGSQEEHYVYSITDVETGEFYVGVRTSKGAAERDGYMGSGAWFSERVSHGSALKKMVLSKHESRLEAESEERSRIVESLQNPLCRNQRTPADSAPRNSFTPQDLHPTPAIYAPLPPQILHPTPADSAPITVKESSIEPKKGRARPAPPPRPDDVAEQVWQDWVAHRKGKGASVSPTVLSEARKEAEKAGLPLERFLAIWCARGSQGLQADWLKPHERGSPSPSGETAYQRSMRERTEQVTPRIAAKPPGNSQNVIEMEVPRVITGCLGR